MADETSGIVIADYSNFRLASFIADTAVTPCGFHNILSTSSSSLSEESLDISIFTHLIQLSIGAQTGATVTITRPDSSSATVVANRQFAVFSEGNPQAGRWNVSVNFGTVQFSLIQRTNVDTTLLYIAEGSNEAALTPPQLIIVYSLLI